MIAAGERAKRLRLGGFVCRVDAPARAEREQFVDWLRESALHVAEMLRVSKVHDALEEFQHWAQIATDGPDKDGEYILPPHLGATSSLVSLPSLRSEDRRTAIHLVDQQREPGGEAFQGEPLKSQNDGKRRKPPLIVTVAATLAAVAILAMLLFPLLSGQTIQTERGERREVALADGSVFEVDPETRLHVTFKEHTRRVSLERGRALFRVAKDPGRPFLVEVDGMTVRAVGTAFGVERQRQGIVVTVAEGTVAVFAADPSVLYEGKEARNAGAASVAEQPKSQSPVPRTRRNAQLLLTAGQQVTMDSSGTAEPVRQVDSERELAWAKGRLVFENQTVATVIKEFNRYNRVQLHVADEVLAERSVSAVFDASDPESFIAFIQTVASIRVIRSDPADITVAIAP